MPAGVSAYVPLANVTLGSSAQSVTFSSISQSYRDLVLVGFVATASDSYCFVQLNSDTGTNYPICNMGGDGSGTYSQVLNANYNYFDLSGGIGSAAGIIFTMHFFDYTTTNKHKPVLWRADKASSGGTLASAGRWANTSAINSIFIDQYSTSTFAAGTTFALYGVSA